MRRPSTRLQHKIDPDDGSEEVEGPSRRQLTFSRETDGRWIASISGVPGADSYGRTKAEADRRVRESVAFYDTHKRAPDALDMIRGELATLPARAARAVAGAEVAAVRPETVRKWKSGEQGWPAVETRTWKEGLTWTSHADDVPGVYGIGRSAAAAEGDLAEALDLLLGYLYPRQGEHIVALLAPRVSGKKGGR